MNTLVKALERVACAANIDWISIIENFKDHKDVVTKEDGIIDIEVNGVKYDLLFEWWCFGCVERIANISGVEEQDWDYMSHEERMELVNKEWAKRSHFSKRFIWVHFEEREHPKLNGYYVLQWAVAPTLKI